MWNWNPILLAARFPRSRPSLLAALLCLCAFGQVRAGEDADKTEPPKPIDNTSKKLTRQLRPELLAGENPFLYLSTPDVKKARAAFERTSFVGLVNEEEVNSPIIAAFSKMRETYVKGDGTRGEAETKRRNEEVDLLVKMFPLLESQVAVAVDLDVTGLANLASGKMPRFMLIAAMPPGDAGGERQAQIEDILESYRGRLTIDAKYHDFDTARNAFAIHGLENAEMGTYEAWAFIENLFVYCQGKGQIEEAIDRYTVRKGAGSLALNSNYQSSYKQVGRDEKGESLVYVQVDPKIVNIDRIESEWARAMIATFAGVSPEGALPQVALGIQIGDGATGAPVREKLFVRSTLPTDVARTGEGCKGHSARFVAGDGLYYSAYQGNFADIFGSFKTFLGVVYGAFRSNDVEQRVQAAMGAKDAAEFKKKLDLFKGEFSYFVEYVPRNIKFASLPDLSGNFQVVLCLEIDRENVNSEASLKELMTKLENGSGIPYVSTNAAGAIIRYQRGSAPGEDRTANVLGLRNNIGVASKNTAFFSCWAKVDLETDGIQRRFLLLADDLPSLRKAMSQRNSPRTSLHDDPKFRETLKGFRESRHHVAYLDMIKATNVYSQLLPVAARSDLIERDQLNKFPSAAALRPHLFPMVDADSPAAKGEGLLTEFSSPTGILPMAALITSVAWPQINYQRQRAISEEVDSKFKQIMLGLQLYAADFDRYPPQLSDLVGPYIELKRLSVFESPFNRGAVQSAIDVDNPELSNLIYIPNRNLQDLGNDIMVYEKQPTRIERGENAKLLYHVMTVDGRVRGIPKAALDRTLAGKFTSTNVKGGGALDKQKK